MLLLCPFFSYPITVKTDSKEMKNTVLKLLRLGHANIYVFSFTNVIMLNKEIKYYHLPIGLNEFTYTYISRCKIVTVEAVNYHKRIR